MGVLVWVTMGQGCLSSNRAKTNPCSHLTQNHPEFNIPKRLHHTWEGGTALPPPAGTGSKGTGEGRESPALLLLLFLLLPLPHIFPR